jgi:hypothetical protein
MTSPDPRGWHVGEMHREEFLRRTEAMRTTDELVAVLGPLFEPVETAT